MAETVGTPVVKNEAAPSTNEMAAFLTSNPEQDFKVEDTTVGDQVEGAETKDALPDGDEGKVAADDAGEKDESPDSKDDAATEKTPKPSQRAKLRAQVEEAKKVVQHVASERNQAVEIANEWRSEAEHWKTQYEQLLGNAKEKYGHAEDPREIELVSVKRQLAAQERAVALQKQREDLQVKQNLMNVKNTLKDQFTNQAQEAAAKFPGLEPRQILVAYAMAQEAGQDIEIVDVARQLSSIAAVSKNRQKHVAARQHLETSNNAPRSINGNRGGKRPEYDATNEGMDAYLKSLKG